MEDNFLIYLDRSILENQRLYNKQEAGSRKRNINATLITLRTVRNKYLAEQILSDTQMDSLEGNGKAEVLYKDAAEDEFSHRFAHTRGNQLVAKVTNTSFYRHTQYGFEPIPEEDIRSPQ